MSTWTQEDFTKTNLLCERLVEAAGEIMRDSCQLKEALNQLSHASPHVKQESGGHEEDDVVEEKKVKTLNQRDLFDFCVYLG